MGDYKVQATYDVIASLGFEDDYVVSQRELVYELAEALDDLIEAVPHETQDADWWPDELREAMRAATAVIAKAGVL